MTKYCNKTVDGIDSIDAFDITVEDDLTIGDELTVTGDTTFDGDVTIDNTSTTALVVRKDTGGTTLVSLDTSNDRIGFGYDSTFLSRTDSAASTTLQRLKLDSTVARSSGTVGVQILNTQQLPIPNSLCTTFSFGKASSIRDSIEGAFNYVADGSTSNSFLMGFNSVSSDLFELTAAGEGSLNGVWNATSLKVGATGTLIDASGTSINLIGDLSNTGQPYAKLSCNVADVIVHNTFAIFQNDNFAEDSVQGITTNAAGTGSNLALTVPTTGKYILQLRGTISDNAATDDESNFAFYYNLNTDGTGNRIKLWERANGPGALVDSAYFNGTISVSRILDLTASDVVRLHYFMFNGAAQSWQLTTDTDIILMKIF